MPYTPNPTWADGPAGGTPITTAALNNMEAGIEDADNRITAVEVPSPSARVTHNATQAIVSGTAPLLAFNTEAFDTDTIHNNVTNNSRLTCKTAGTYLIGAVVPWAGSAGGTYREAGLFLNGATLFADVLQGIVSAGVGTAQSLSTIYALAVNDYVEVRVSHDVGSNLNVNAGVSFWMVKVA